MTRQIMFGIWSGAWCLIWLLLYFNKYNLVPFVPDTTVDYAFYINLYITIFCLLFGAAPLIVLTLLDNIKNRRWDK